MGIKTRFNPMGNNGGGEPHPQIPDYWLYTNRTNEAGKKVRTLYFYNNSLGGDVVNVPFGYTELQDFQQATNNSYETLPFFKHNTLTNVDLNNVPFRNNSMYEAFFNCYKLTSVNGINKNVTNMASTFYNCTNLNQNIQIPNSVTSMVSTFYNCSSLNQNIQIPNSVTSMVSTFYSCINLNQNIQIPNSVTSMYFTFRNCTNLNQNIQIPNSVTDMARTFFRCYNLNQNIRIPNSVTDMASTFYCTNLNQNIQIPNSVTSMSYTFYSCTQLGGAGRRINILSTQISNAANCFGYMNASRRRNVYIYFKYANGVNTLTYNTFKSAVTTYSNGSTYTNLCTNKANTYVYNLGLAPW